MKLNNETRRTKAVKRGGQHPEWDEEVRFTIVEDVEDELARTAGGDTTDNSPPPPPPKKDKEKEKKKIKGPKQMQLMCYADDPREPSLIGETMVDLTEVLTKGETDGEYKWVLSRMLIPIRVRMVYPRKQGEVLWRGLPRTDFLV